MEFTQLNNKLYEKIISDYFIQGTISQPRLKSNDLQRVRMKRIKLKDTFYIQFEYQYERILKHENIALEDVQKVLTPLLKEFRQVHAQLTEEQIQIQISKKFKVMWKNKQETLKKRSGFFP